MTSNEVTISTTLSLRELADGSARITSGSKAVALKPGEDPQLLLLDEEHTFTISVTTLLNDSGSPVEYPAIVMVWDNGFDILLSEGWNRNAKNELSFSGSADIPSITVKFLTDALQIGIILVGTAELPLGGGKQ